MKLILPDKFAAMKPQARLTWAATAQELVIRRFNRGDEMEDGLALAKRRIWEPRFHLLGAEIAAARRELWLAGTPEQKADPFWVPGDRQGLRGNASKADMDRLGDLRDLFVGAVDAQGLPDPYQDLSTYTEVDPGSDIAISGTGSVTATCTAMPANVSSYVYKDFTAGHFADFTHDYETAATDSSGLGTVAIFAPWAVSNVVNDAGYWYTNSSQAALTFWFIRVSGPPYWSLYLRDSENGSGDQDSYNINGATTYYNSAVRSGTSLVHSIYSDSGRTTLVDAQSVTLASGRTYQYHFAMSSYNASSANWVSGWSQNHDLHEAASGPVIPVFMNQYRQRRA